MTRDRFDISYGPPLAVKDRPHRELDTARGVHDALDCDELGRENVVVIGEFEASDAVEVEIVEASVAEVVTFGAE